MTLFVDPSAMLHRYVRTEHSEWVGAHLSRDETWVVSSLALTELRLSLHRLALGAPQDQTFEQRLRDDFAALYVVPLDDRCTQRAGELGMTFGLRTIDALQLAAADRLPRPASFLTLDRHQIPAAAELGFHVLAPIG